MTASIISIPHRIAGFALTGTLFVLILLGSAHHSGVLRGDVIFPGGDDEETIPSSSLRSAHDSHSADYAAPLAHAEVGGDDAEKSTSYYVFLQKFPLENSWRKLFHTEVVVCPRENFSGDAEFLKELDDSVRNELAPPAAFTSSSSGPANGHPASTSSSTWTSKSVFASFFAPSQEQEEDIADTNKVPFVEIDESKWSVQTNAGCVQLGYGGNICSSGCCGSPHKHENTHYALSSRNAVIGNAMSEYKELYFYGVSGSVAGEEEDDEGANRPAAAGISGNDAYKAVCHGQMNAITLGPPGMPKCVSDWRGQDYNPLTNNCNTYTSAILKCVYGLSDAKPNLGVSDMRTVTCPTEKGENGGDVERCVIPSSELDVLGSETASETSNY